MSASRVLLGVYLLGCGLQADETYDVRGRVERVEPAAAVVEIAHAPIPGFMPAMTMNFDVAEPELLEGVLPGASVRFTLERSATALRITSLRVTAPPPNGWQPVGSAPAPELAPSFVLTDQDGAPVELAQFAGRAVLLDFIFTRCPGPCPILTAAHARLQSQLPTAVRKRTAFVSISLDPEHDTPAVLRDYAERRGADLSTWSFLTGPPERVAEVVAAYHVGTLRQADGEIDHTVATFLIDPEGRIAERYLGLQHEAEDMVAALERALSR